MDRARKAIHGELQTYLRHTADTDATPSVTVIEQKLSFFWGLWSLGRKRVLWQGRIMLGVKRAHELSKLEHNV